MQLDKQMLDKLLTLNDAQLAEVIRSIAAETGIDPNLLGLNPQNINGIRQALGSATQQDLEQLNAVYDSYKQNRKRS